VLQILRKYPLCDIYDLVRVDEKLWASISRELGGLSYGDAIRRPRSLRDKAKQPAVTRDTTQKAYALLKKLGWCWKPSSCACGGKFELLSFAHSQKRGHGRRFMRCSDCETYKDVLAWSHLPKLRLALPSLVEAMKIWFASSVPPSSDHVGRQIGVCGQNKSSLKTLFDALAKHEASLALDLQSRTNLSGHMIFFLAKARCSHTPFKQFEH